MFRPPKRTNSASDLSKTEAATALWEKMIMSDPCEGKCGNTRRGLLQRALAVVAAVPFLGLTVGPSKAAKMAKTAVAYQDHPEGGKQCSGCTFFLPPSSCKMVEGKISPHGHCRLWTAKS